MSKPQLDPPPYSPTPYTNHPSTLQSQLSHSRTQHITNTISTTILPLLQHRALHGLSWTTIALLPVNITTPLPTSWTNASSNSDTKTRSTPHDDPFPAPPPQIIEIVSSHSTDDDADIQRIQLGDPIDTAAFWSQPAVLDELTLALRETLYAQHAPKLEASSDSKKVVTVPSVSEQGQTQPAQKQRSRGVFSRLGSGERRKDGAAMANANANVNVDVGRKVRPPVSVHVESEEVVLRTLTEFGLYETLTRKAVLVRVRID